MQDLECSEESIMENLVQQVYRGYIHALLSAEPATGSGLSSHLVLFSCCSMLTLCTDCCQFAHQVLNIQKYYWLHEQSGNVTDSFTESVSKTRLTRMDIRRLPILQRGAVLT